MITVDTAQALCLGLIHTLPQETVKLADAQGRTLSAPVHAKRDQPPFSASAMDGYAVKRSDTAVGAVLTVVGEAAAGRGWDRTVQSGEACRIFTGAPLPKGADRVVLQEDVIREKDQITLGDGISDNINVRPKGADFKSDFALEAPRLLSPPTLALIAAMNQPEVSVTRRPKVALISNGDELLMPGGDPGPDQIIASNVFALAAMLRDTGAQPNILPIAPDRADALDAVLEDAENWGADIIVTIGGASVGDHDLVAPALDRFGVTRAFHKIAMRPGKPLMAGSKGATAVLGLPGNPVSAVVCGHLFLLPMVRKALGQHDVLPQIITAQLTDNLRPGGPRAHYMRARFDETPDGRRVTAFDKQDSSMLTVLSNANCLLMRPINAPAALAGCPVDILPL